MAPIRIPRFRWHIFAVCGGCKAGCLLELPGKVSKIIVPAADSDLRNAPVRLGQKQFGAIDPQSDHIPHQAVPGFLLKDMGNVIFVEK